MKTVSTEKYYTQRLARQSADSIVPIPENLIIPPRHLNGISNEEFIAAFHTYHSVLRQMYNDIAADPQAFGMVCLDIEESNYKGHRVGPVTKDESKSRKSFFRLPVLLLDIAHSGEFTSDGSLAVNKIATPAMLEKLCDYGFVTEKLPDKSAIISYPDDKNVLAVLKAFAVVEHYEKLISADYRYLLDDTVTFDFDDMLRTWPNKTDKQVAKIFYEKFAGLGYYVKIEYNIFFGKTRIAPSKSKKEIVYLDSDRDSVLRIKLRLQNIARYADKLGELSPNILNQTLGGSSCGNCGGCKNGIAFSFRGTNYKKCYVICAGFVYSGFGEQDTESLTKLIDWELNS